MHQIIHKPDQAVMAGLLGSAIGVMATVSLVELIVKNAMENDSYLIMASTVAGALVYYFLEPLIPKVDGPVEGRVEEVISIKGPSKVRKWEGQGGSGEGV
jgi:hypothetical protein